MDGWHCHPPDIPPNQYAPVWPTTGGPTPLADDTPDPSLDASRPPDTLGTITATNGPTPRWSSRPHAGLPDKFNDIAMY